MHPSRRRQKKVHEEDEVKSDAFKLLLLLESFMHGFSFANERANCGLAAFERLIDQEHHPFGGHYPLSSFASAFSPLCILHVVKSYGDRPEVLLTWI